MVTYEAPPSLGFFRQEHWSRLPFPFPMHESEKWKWSCSFMPTLSDPMDCSLPGSSVHGIFQAGVPERVAIAFSGPTSYTLFNAFLWQSWNPSYFWTWALHFHFAKSSTNYAAAPACITDFVMKTFLNLFLLAWHFLTGKNLGSKHTEWFTMVFTVVRHLLALRKRNFQT